MRGANSLISTDVILPEREMCQKLLKAIRAEENDAICRLRAEASESNEFKYSLRGVIQDVNTVFLRKRETSLMEMDENPSPHDQWWKVICLFAEGNTILAEVIHTFL